MAFEVWSINTTVRNPNRLLEFLNDLKKFEGMKFDKSIQIDYQREIVKNKHYKPINLPDYLKCQYENADPFSEKDTDEIFAYVNNKDFRGRTSVSRLNQMGLVIAKQSEEKVIITDLGKKLIDGTLPLSEFFLRYFLKWQLPNPIDFRFKNFNLSPFICTLYIINKVNILEKKRGNKSKGVSKREFALFIITLNDFHDVDDVANDILKYRNELKESDDKNSFYVDKLYSVVKNIFGVSGDNAVTKANNLEDYADSAIRWFRMTDLLYYRGEKHYVDISPSHIKEVEKILNNIPLNSQHFSDENEYRNYLIDTNMPELPWEDVNSLKNILISLFDLIEDKQKQIDLEYPGKRTFSYTAPDINIDDVIDLKNIVQTTRNLLNQVNNEYITLKENDIFKLDKYIDELTNLSIMKSTNPRYGNAPLCLEWFTSLSLMALDDAKVIKPNFTRGDDGIPTFTAPGGVPDIECYYESFNLIVEVTLMKGRVQVNNEVQPLLRHYVDFVYNNVDEIKKSFALFIAPFFHRDVINMLKYYIDSFYEGHPVNLVLLTIEQYADLLKIFKDKHDNGIVISHKMLENFFDECVDITLKYDTPLWNEKTNDLIKKYGKVV